MMKNKILMTAVALSLLLGFQSLHAQGRSSSKEKLLTVLTVKGSGEKAEKGVPSYIQTTLKETSRFKTETEQIESSGSDRKNTRGWIEIAVPFKTTYSERTPWLENTEVEIRVMVPMRDDRMKITWGVLSGKILLAPIPNNPVDTAKNTHYFRAYIPPYIVARYFPAIEKRKDLEKIVEALPVFVAFRLSNGSMAYGIRPLEKDFAKFAGKSGIPAFPAKIKIEPAATGKMFAAFDANPRTFFEVPDAILPASKTPWAWHEYDKQVNPIEDTRRR